MVTVHYTPKDACIPQAYWGDANNPAITGTATLGAINGNTLTLSGVAVGLKLISGDLVGFTIGDFNFIARIVADTTAVSTNMQVKIEPFLPSYIGVGATVRFKNPVMNMRMMPNSLEIGNGFFRMHHSSLLKCRSEGGKYGKERKGGNDPASSV